MVECGVCGKVKEGYAEHREEHVSPPRVLDICRGCHRKVHDVWQANLKVEVCSDPNCWTYRLLEGRLTDEEKMALHRMVLARLNQA